MKILPLMAGHNIIFLSKNPFFWPDKPNVHPYLAGHSVGLTYPLTKQLLKYGAYVDLVHLAGTRQFETQIEKNFPSPPKSNLFNLFIIEPILEPKVPQPFPTLEIAKTILNIASSKKGLITILVVYTYPSIFGAVLAKQINPSKIKIVALFRGSDLSRFFNRTDPYGLELIRLAASYCDRVYVPSKNALLHAKKMGLRINGLFPAPALPSSPVFNSVIPGSYDARKIFFNFNRRRLGLPREILSKPWIVSCSRTGIERPVDDVITAFETTKLKDNSFYIVASPLTHTFVKKRDGIYNIFVPPEIVPDFLYSCSLLVHPTRRNDFWDARPQVVTQAAFLGTPVVLPKSAVIDGGASESLSPENVKLMTYNDYDSQRHKSLAKKCLRVLNDKKLETFIRKANIRSSRQFGLDKCGRRLVNIICNLHNPEESNL